MATTPTTATAPAVPAEGQLVFQLTKLAQPLKLKQDVVDSKWHNAMLVGFIISCFVVPGLIGYVGYRMGASEQPASAPTANTQSATPVAPQWKTYADCVRGYVLTAHKDPEGACDSLPH